MTPQLLKAFWPKLCFSAFHRQAQIILNGYSERAFLKKPFVSSLLSGSESGNVHAHDFWYRKPNSTETSTLLVLLVRISKPLVQCWLWFVNSEHPGNALCLCYFRMMWLRPYFKQLLLRKELFTDHETTPKIIHTTASRQKGKQVE